MSAKLTKEMIEKMDKEQILSEETLTALFNETDPIKRAILTVALDERAGQVGNGAKTHLKTMFAAFSKVEKQMKQEQKKERSIGLVDNWTNFIGPYPQMRCGSWAASDDGIFTSNGERSTLDSMACYHPILPLERLKNLETGEEQIKLAYKRNGRWMEILTPKVMVTSASKIVALSARGVSVTSENAKNLVKYLSDVENLNDSCIKVQYSSSKLGWAPGNLFLPYDQEIVFDGDTRFQQLFNSIGEHGSREVWYDCVREIRKGGRIESKFLLAAAFASVLIKALDALPFFVDLWGETEGGKTVTLMLAASVWADPDESRYIGDFKSTDVALEAKADMLNNLPLILDDTSKTSSRIRENFEGVVYYLCSGKGKSRSNKNLGINRENRWKNVIMTNGERPLNSYVNQGGAINRILEVECGEKVYPSPQNVVETLKNNYGYAGKEFVSLVKSLGEQRIRKIQRSFQEQLMSDDKMQKQAMSLAIVLTADKIATDYLFQDGCYISLEEAKKTLVDRNEVSDTERCYRFIIDKVGMNPQRFDDETKCEKWGVVRRDCVLFLPTAFEQLCRDGGFSKKSFLSWAQKNKILETSGDRFTKVCKIGGKSKRCFCIKMEEMQENNGFVQQNIPLEDNPFQ